MIEVEAKTLWDDGVEKANIVQYHQFNNKHKSSAHCSCLLTCHCYYMTHIP